MSRFHPEINSKIVEQVNFDAECSETFKEDIRIFKVLNSIKALKPIISKYMSIWIMYPEEIQFNYLKYSQTLKDLKKCTDSFFIITTDRPRGGHHLTYHEDHSPLIFDVHNFLGLEAPQSGLCLGIDQETLLEKLVLLSEKRPKRIIELTLPHGVKEMNVMGFCFYNRIVKGRYDKLYIEDMEKMRLCSLRRLTGIFVDFNKEFDVSIDHKTVLWFPISDYDEYDFDECFRKVQNLKMEYSWFLEYVTVSTEFWGPTPILNKIGIDKINEITSVRSIYDDKDKAIIHEFSAGLRYARKELWTHHHELLFHSEFYRINRAPYYYLIETLSSKKWE